MKKKPRNRIKPAPFYFEELGKEVLLTNDGGDFMFLEKEEFKRLAGGKTDKNSSAFQKLLDKNFIIGKNFIDRFSEKYNSRSRLFFSGPSLHIVVVTLRCNHKCLYCHASAQNMSRKDLDMDRKTAAKVCHTIFRSPSNFIAIEFQGGEPLVNWPIVKYIIEKAEEINRKAKKDLEIRLVSNFSLMTKEKFDYLISKKVSLCVSLDGPKKLHNQNRPMISGKNSYAHASKWLKKFNDLYPKLKKKGYIYKMGVSVTISRNSLPLWKEIIDKYLELGVDEFYLRPLNPFGFSLDSWKKIGYSMRQYIKFYEKSLDYIIELNKKGKKVKEKMALTFLRKILTDTDPNHLDYRSPCGAGIGQLAYNWNGDVYTCDEGRMLSMMGDENFKLGSVEENSYDEIVSSPRTRTVCAASCLEGLAGCHDCVYKPYCGVCPIYNYSTSGNLFGQMPMNERCQLNKALFGYLFKKIQDNEIRSIFESWV